MGFIKTKLVLFWMLLILMANCTNNASPQEPDLYTVSTILTGKVLSQETENSPLEGATVYLTEKGFDCNSHILAEPIKFDSTTTDANGEFTIKIDFLNAEKPICLETFASFSKDDTSLNTNVVEFTTPLKREPPYDTTKINLVLRP